MNLNLSTAEQSRLFYRPDSLGNPCKKERQAQTHYWQFYISRYPFSQNSVSSQVKLYKTFYECEGFQLNRDKLERLTGMNKLGSLVKIKQIVKNVPKHKISQKQKTPNTQIHNYSLYYQIVQHFFLSPSGISIIKNLFKNPKDYHRLFEPLLSDLQHLINNKIYYLIDVQNIGITPDGKIKIYIPANYVFEETIFTDHHENEMRTTAKVTVECLLRYLQSGVGFNQYVDVDRMRHNIRREVFSKVEIKPTTIESQIFTLNQQHQSLQGNQNLSNHNQVLEKTVKIKKSNEKIQFVSANQFNQAKHAIPKQPSRHHGRCLTNCGEFEDKNKPGTKFENGIKSNHHDLSELTATCPNKENEILKERMKDYEQKLLSLNNTVKQMKEELMTMNNKKDANYQRKGQRSLQKTMNQKERSKSYTNLSEINVSRDEYINMIFEKLSTSRYEIKRLLHDDTILKKSYLLEQQDEDFQEINQIDQILLSQEIENLKGFNNCNEGLSSAQNNRISELREKTHSNRQQNNSKDKKEISKLHLPEQSRARRSSNRKSRVSYEYESSNGKYSSPEGNPFRQYGNFRIQYVINQDENQKNQSPEKRQKVGGHIQIHREPSPRPYKIVRTPAKQQRLFYPVVRIREPFRYSCLAVPRELADDVEYIAVLEDVYDPSDYDSVNTYERELGFGREYKMPRIVSKNAFRHTLFPSNVIGKRRMDETIRKGVSREKQGSFSRSLKKHQSSNRLRQSAGNQAFLTYFQRHSFKNRGSFSRDELFVQSNEMLPKIRQDIEKFHEVLMDESTDDKRNDLKRNKETDNSPQPKEICKRTNNGNEMNLGLLRAEKKPIDKEKLHAVLNRSKQIISRYKKMTNQREK